MYKFNYLKKNYFLSSIKILSLFGVLLLMVACNSTVENNITYFGGKIKNPRGKYVYLLKGDKTLDSTILNSNNKFIFQIDSIQLGLYTFKHGPEFQYLYLEPKDSLLLYLDTWGFDESLVFSGKGSAKNNFLINLFVEQEKNEKIFYDYYNLDENEFSEKIDSTIDVYTNQYNDLILSEEKKPSPFFDNLANIAYKYPLYLKKERYQFYHKNSNGLYDYPKVNPDFFQFRKSIDLNDESLLGFWPYSMYLEGYLKNIAYHKELIDSTENNFALNYMKAVNEKIDNKKIKNMYLSNGFWASLSQDYCSKDERKKIDNYYFNNCSDEKLKSESKLALEQLYLLNKGDQMPDIVLTDTQGSKVKLLNIVENKNSVIYFWPNENGYSEMILEKLPKLKEKYPNVNFVGIDRNKTNKQWESFLVKNKLQKNNQYKINEKSEHYLMFKGGWARTLVIDSNGGIINPFLFFNKGYEIEKHLKKTNKY